MGSNKKEFTGVWIPAIVIEDTDLTWVQKAIYAEIACYKKCYMTNKHIAEVVSCSESYVTKTVTLLKGKGYIIDSGFDGRTRNLTAFVNVEGSTPVLGRVALQSESAYHPSATRDNIKDNKEILTPAKADSVSPKKEDKAFNSLAWIDSLLSSTQPHINLIGSYFIKYAKHNFPTKAVAEEEMKKNMAPASFLVKNFKPEDITKTLIHCQDNFSDINWNLHTVKKQISHVTAKK
jgi:hypothetical protein